MADKVTVNFGNILYAEDDQLYQITTPLILSRIGFTVKVVGNGKLAVEEFSSDSNYSSVLLDNQMPIMTGIEAARRILEKKTVDIVLFTSDEKHTVSEAVDELGIRYLKKPGTEMGFKILYASLLTKK
ncbi:response regulator [Simkania negevensis]|nr:response regulator [Simkania negevensis]MCB1073959.1 response regulator [Simkania sp.]